MININEIEDDNDEAKTKTESASHRSALNGNSAVLNAVELKIEAYLGDAVLSVAALKALTVEEVIELDATLNQAVELRLNGVAVAQGELVCAGDKFGVRITDLAQ